MARRTVEELEQDVSKVVLQLERALNNSLNRFFSALRELTPNQRREIISRLPIALEALPSYQAALAGIEVIYGKELRSALDNVAKTSKQKVTANEEDYTLAASLIEIDKAGANNKLNSYVTDLQRNLLLNETSPIEISIDDFRELAEPRLFRNVEAELRTSSMGYNRAMNISKALQMGITKFRYTGPDDSITRPFCDYLLGDSSALATDKKSSIPNNSRKHNIYSIEEIRKMSNGQGLNVAQFAGGYNCRHRWVGISDDRAKQVGYIG